MTDVPVDEIVAAIQEADDDQARQIEGELLAQSDNAVHPGDPERQPLQTPAPLSRDELEL